MAGRKSTAKASPLMNTKTPPSIYFPLFLVFYEIATYLSNDMYLPALPDMMRDLHLTTQQAQLTLTTWFVGSATLPLIMGIISDRWGRRPTLLLGGIVYFLSSIVCAITHDPQILLIARFIQGAAIPSMMVAGYACIHEIYNQKEAIRILALMGSITILAPALGPLLGSLILLFTSWRGIFWIIALWAALAILCLYRFMPETCPPEKRQPIHWNILFAQYSRIITNKQFILLMCVLGFIFAGFIVWIAAGSLLVIETFQQSPLTFGVIQAIIFAAYIIGNRWVKYLLESMSVARLIWIGILFTLCGGLLSAFFAVILPESLYAFLFAMTIYSFGSALCFAPLNRSIIETSEEPMSARVALFTTAWTGFGVLGSLFASKYFNGGIASIAYPLAVAICISCVMNLLAHKI